MWNEPFLCFFLFSDKIHECSICKRTFKQAAHLKYHLHSHLKQSSGSEVAAENGSDYGRFYRPDNNNNNNNNSNNKKRDNNNDSMLEDFGNDMEDENEYEGEEVEEDEDFEAEDGESEEELEEEEEEESEEDENDSSSGGLNEPLQTSSRNDSEFKDLSGVGADSSALNETTDLDAATPNGNGWFGWDAVVNTPGEMWAQRETGLRFIFGFVCYLFSVIVQVYMWICVCCGDIVDVCYLWIC